MGLAEQALLEARQEVARLRSAAAASGSDADALAQKSARGHGWGVENLTRRRSCVDCKTLDQKSFSE